VECAGRKVKRDSVTVYRARFRSETCCVDRQQLKGKGNGSSTGGHEKGRRGRGGQLQRRTHDIRTGVSATAARSSPPLALFPWFPSHALPLPSFPFPCSGRSLAEQGARTKARGKAVRGEEGGQQPGQQRTRMHPAPCVCTPRRSPSSVPSSPFPFPVGVMRSPKKKMQQQTTQHRDASQPQLNKGTIHKGSGSG